MVRFHTWWERSRADCFSAPAGLRVPWQRSTVLLEDDLSLKGQTDSEVESSLRKISDVCKKLYKYLPLLFFPTEIILQKLWKIIWTTDSYLNFTSFRILHFFYWWNDMRHFTSAEFWCPLSWRNLPFSELKQRPGQVIVGWTLYFHRAIYNICEETLGI